MGTWQDFEGVNLLSGYNKIVGELIARNELGGISNGYELSHAGVGTSGYSYGGNQLDLANNQNASDLPPKPAPLTSRVCIDA